MGMEYGGCWVVLRCWLDVGATVLIGSGRVVEQWWLIGF
ncbi:hypothetical protein BVRB_2g039190 [Beta vulgaris subsp. vulgaris]|nr:hypothetical protein BVRB_2g039190 [Beta vulgaris subsp. vulgaris]